MYYAAAGMAASHFFIGLSAGIAILAVPVLTLTPGSTVPRHIIEWIEGAPSQPAAVQTTDAAVNRPLRGYQPGDPTPAPEAVPTVGAIIRPTLAPTVQVAPAGQVSQVSTANLRWAGTGVIRSGGIPVYVRRVPGIDSRDDPQLPDGSPVLVSTGQPLQVGNQQWRAVRGLSGVVGWVTTGQLAVDGEAAPTPIVVAAAATPTVGPRRASIANTDGSGVVLRNSPNDADRSRSGLMDGAGVTILEVSGSDWVHVRADNGQSGWVPARYVATQP